MPKRTDLKSILLLGAGPIVIGQACEFDYSGTQACKALKEEGYRVILVNSNPATIMTDPETADVIYIEPLDWKTIAQIIEKEQPDALLPTMGGQTALNCALDLERKGVLEQHHVQMIGASREAIDKAEDRQLFRDAMTNLGLETARSFIAHNMDDAIAAAEQIGFPVIIRPSFTMGGSGGGIAYNREEFISICERGLDLSPTSELLIEESVLGWKEFEMEVVRDSNDNCIIICSIENVDPMGVHTGDSITVAPAQTLTDKEYQLMRNASIAVLREIGVDTGGSNVQFAINPDDGRMIVIEMNPRVSRSSALASKATGFPIAKVAAKLAVGYTLDELRNEITGGTIPASFEPSIDYVVTKVPRFAFEKFPQANDRLTTQMKSVGEVMAIGRNFQESLQKALRGLETGVDGLTETGVLSREDPEETITYELRFPGPDRLWYIADAFRFGLTIEQVHTISQIDPWFLAQIEDLVNTEQQLVRESVDDLTEIHLRLLKRKGFSDSRLATLLRSTEDTIRALRHHNGIYPVFKRIDSCAAEFASSTAYLYSSYDQECEAQPTQRKKIIILGGGPNRIGQGIEFDYCCVHAALAMREAGYESIMINCNPETVSTDFDISDRLYFEPLTLEDVLEVIRIEKPTGVIVQYGGQTPLKLARALEAEQVPIIGTSPDAIDLAEDRERFQQLIHELDLMQPPNHTVRSASEATARAEQLGFPLVVRPSYVLGGRAMEIVFNQNDLSQYMQEAVDVSNESPVLLDRFLENAIEMDVDVICDGKHVLIGGLMQHIEQAGIHSGDSACSLPAYDLSNQLLDSIREQVSKLARSLNVVGLMNAQFAIQGDDIYVLEVNPRASRTVPFVSKATGYPLAKIAAKCMIGVPLHKQGASIERIPDYYSVKEAVFPFIKFPGVDTLLGPEMKSTGEVMGVGTSFGEAYAKAQLGIGDKPLNGGTALISVRNEDKPKIIQVARDLQAVGFHLAATRGTAKTLQDAGIQCTVANKIKEDRPHIVDMIKNDEIQLLVNTTSGKKAISDSYLLRREALQHQVTYITTLAGAVATCLALAQDKTDSVHRLEELHQSL